MSRSVTIFFFIVVVVAAADADAVVVVTNGESGNAADAEDGGLGVWNNIDGGAVVASTHVELGLDDAENLDVSTFARQRAAAS